MKSPKVLSLQKKVVPPLITLAIVVLAWQLIGESVNPLFLSTPTAIANAFGVLAAGTGEYSLIGAVENTFEAMLVGFAVGVALAVPLGLLMGLSPAIEAAFDPYVNALYVVPRIALIPILVIWFGVGFEAIAVIVTFHTFFPVVINSHAGVKNLDKAYTDVSKAFGVKGFVRFRRVVLPGALPYVMAGLRIGLGQAFIGVIVAQMILALSGFGFILTGYSNYLDTPEIMAIILIIMAFGVVLTEGIKYIERHLVYWRTIEGVGR